MMKTQKGFTLVELLAVILLLGLLITVVLVSANKLIKTSDKKYYQGQEKMMTLAAKEYFHDYRSYLPKTIKDTKKVLLETLVTEKYIDKIVDTKQKDCDRSASYVLVTKKSTTDYLYQAILVCPDGHYQTKL